MAGDGVAGGGTRGRSWEGWGAGCGRESDGDQLVGIRSPQVADTSDQSKVGKER